MKDLSKVAVVFLATAGLGLTAGAASTDSTARETAGWHLIRPGEDLDSVAQRYLRDRAFRQQLSESNPLLGEPEPGERILVQLHSGLPRGAAIVSRLSGRVDAQPTPISWTRGRRFDLLAVGDGVRTLSSASVEMFFADASRLMLTEDSLAFLRLTDTEIKARHSGEIEIVEGQADLERRGKGGRKQEGLEIVLGEARLKTRPNRAGEVGARARRSAAGGSQVMVYRGTGEIAAAGKVVEVAEGLGSVIPAAGPPSPPEALLPAPVLIAPDADASRDADVPRFRWSAVEGAASYTFELCLDPECLELIEREAGLRESSLRESGLRESGLRQARRGRAAGGNLVPGRYFWRVTATAPSSLDGYPSATTAVTLLPEPSQATVASTPSTDRSGLMGSVRSRPDAIPLPGVRIQVLETGGEAWTSEDGNFVVLGLEPGIYTLEAHMPGFVVGQIKSVLVHPGRPAEVMVFLDAAPLTRDEIIVRPSRLTLMSDDPIAPLALDREEILALPHLADDIFRALPLLPGATANDISAQFHIRGGRRDEVEIRLAGQELYGAYHLKDFDNALSIVAPAALGAVDLMTGGFSAQFGDRMSGVLDMTTLEPQEERRIRLGAGLLTLQAGISDTFEGDRGSWMIMARRGSIDLAGKIFGKEDPSYWDALAKGVFRLGNRQTLAVHALASDDELAFEEVDGDGFKERRTRHDSTYVWATHRALLSPRMFVDTFASWSRVDSERRSLEQDEDQLFRIDDLRGFDVWEGRQAWQWEASGRHFLSWGAGVRRFEAPYDYFSDRHFDTPLAQIRALPEDGEIRFIDRFTGENTSAYATDRVRLTEDLTLEAGLRWDRQSLQQEDHVSPRLNLAWSFGDARVLRASWGLFHQSQRPYELQAEDGETELFRAERSEQFLLGFERIFGRESRLSGMALRVEAYRREIDNPRRRFENLYEPFNTFPELEPDRVLVEPERSRSQGVEIFLRGSAQHRLRWWANYAWAASEDWIVSEEGAGEWIPRIIDQTHTLNLNLDISLGKRWSLNLAGRIHSGLPTTPLSIVEVVEDPEEGPELVPVLGRINSESLSLYHRLDLRASRELNVRRGKLTFYIDVQNVYNRRNHSGFDYQVDEDTGALLNIQESWPGIFPSLGISWEF